MVGQPGYSHSEEKRRGYSHRGEEQAGRSWLEADPGCSQLVEELVGLGSPLVFAEGVLAGYPLVGILAGYPLGGILEASLEAVQVGLVL